MILADQSRTDRAKPRSAAIMALAVMIGAFEFGLGLPVEDGGQVMNANKSIKAGSGVALAACITFAAAAQPVGRMEMAETVNFDNASVGSAPEGWILTMTGRGDPRWTVERDDTAPSKANVLKQSGNATYPLALKKGANIKDGFVAVKFKAISGSEDRAAGLVWRAADANNYYVVRANALEDNMVLYKTVNGVRSPLDIVGRSGGYGADVPVLAGQWHTLRADFAGTRFSVTYNGKALFEVDDATFKEAGNIGLWTKADSVTVFDDLRYGETR